MIINSLAIMNNGRCCCGSEVRNTKNIIVAVAAAVAISVAAVALVAIVVVAVVVDVDTVAVANLASIIKLLLTMCFQFFNIFGKEM